MSLSALVFCLLLVLVYVSLVSGMCVLHMMVDGYAARWSFRESAALERIGCVLIMSRYVTPVPVIVLSCLVVLSSCGGVFWFLVF